MKSDRQRPVAIVGGGFSGTMMAAHLARRGVPAVLIEGGGRAGRGTAYSTPEPAHLLNVRAEGMSAWPDRAADFAERVEREGGTGRDFAERRLFGRYLGEILNDARAAGVELVEQRAVAAGREDNGWRIATEDGSSIEAGALVLANGNQPPEPLRVFEQAGERFINNPWSDAAAAAVNELGASGGDALLIGTGLTMVDTVLSLDEAGHRGRIVALSRRGQIPRAHADIAPAAVERDDVPHGNVLALWRWLRRRGAEHGWRQAVDGLRPHSHSLWQALDGKEQRRFVRHARPWWDVHRHRIAPQVSEQLRDMVAEGRLEVIAGRIAGVERTSGGLRVEIARRGVARPPTSAPDEAGEFAFVFNCTGPLGAIARTRDPLLSQLLADRSVTPDELGMGLDVDSQCRAGERIWALGPLTKGRYWEIVAVPDIRGQAANVADDIARSLGDD